MFADFGFWLIFCLGCLLSSIILWSVFLLKRREQKIIKRAIENTLNDLTIKGMLKRQGEVGLVIQHVFNPEVVDTFIKKFNEAFTETAHCIELHNGEIRLWFKIADVKMAEKIKDELEAAGFYVGNNREDIG